jgi:coproporphyrinogen III oxidase-like Fe-S oxidoreductase
MNAQLPKLETALADELVIIEPESIRVTALGNTLVRHICAAFDRDLNALKSKGKYAQGV